MKVSIITVCFNSAETISTAIESVLNQSYPDIEYIVVDGGSKDNTIDIIENYSTKFNGRLSFVSERDEGLYDAMNKGIRMANGVIIGVVNSDDLLNDPGVIEKIVKVFKENPDVQSVYGDLYYVDQFNIAKVVRTWRSGTQKPFYAGWHPPHPSFYVRKKVYDDFGNFDLSFRIAADFELMLRFLEKHKIKTEYLSEVVVRMRLGGVSNRNFKNAFAGRMECLRAFKKNDVQKSKIYLIRRLVPKLKQYF